MSRARAFAGVCATALISSHPHACACSILHTCKAWPEYENVDIVKRAAALRKVFDELDEDRGESLDVNELRPFIAYHFAQHVKQTPDYEMIEAMFYALDTDDTADIDFSEFLWCATFHF